MSKSKPKSKSKSAKENVALSALLFLALLLECVVGWDGFSTRESRREARAAVFGVYSQLKVGMPQETIDILCRQAVERHPKLKFKGDTHEASLETPLETGAKNWIFYLVYDEEHKLRHAKIRCLDSYNYRPPDAPEDIGSPSL